MKLIVFGYKRHGKDTACEFLRDQFDLGFSSSSWKACELFVFDAMKDEHGYATPLECFEDRHNHRAYWYDAIEAYNTPDPCRLGRIIFNEHDVYCGIRSKMEFEGLKQAGLFDLAVWIDAGGRLPPEESSSMSLSMSDADIVIDNNGSLADLHHHLTDLHQVLFERPYDKAPQRISRERSA